MSLLISWIHSAGWQIFVNWIKSDFGSFAEVIGSFGTMLAFIGVIWQQNRQESISRAIHVEESRPRFSVSYTPEFKKDDLVLFWNKTDKELDEISKVLNDRYRFINVENISNNIVYEFSAILEYHSKDNSMRREDYWGFSGVYPKQKMIVIPKFKGENLDKIGEIIYDKLIIKYTTPANEIGFFVAKNYNEEQTDSCLGMNKYYFVKGRHIKHVTAINNDEMISVNSDICKEYDRKFESLYGNTSYKIWAPK